MHRYLITAMLLITVPAAEVLSQSAAWGWARSFTGSGSEVCTGVAADSRNSIYSYGTFTADTLYISNQHLAAPGGGIFLLRHDTLGNLIWARRFGNSSLNSPDATAITTDINGQVVLTGSFTGTISFGPYTLTSAGGSDGFIVKLRPDGTVIWVKQLSGTLDDGGGPVTTDNTGNLYTAGTFRSSSLTIGGSAVSPSGTVKLYYCALDSNGNNLWVQSAGSAANCSIYDIEVLKTGSIIMGGNLESGGTLSFAPGGASPMSTSYHSVFTVKLSGAGNFTSQSITGAGTRYFGRGMAVNRQQQYIEGGYSTFLSTNPPVAQLQLRDTAYATAATAATSRLSPAGPVTVSDVAVNSLNRVIVLASNAGNNVYGSGFTLSTSGVVPVIWELDSNLVTRGLLPVAYQTGISGTFSKLTKDTLTGALYMAGFINGAAGGSYIAGADTVPHMTGQDACIVQIRRQPATALLAFAGSDANVCQGRSVIVGVPSGAAGGMPPYTYSWSPATGLANPSAASTTAAPASTTAYTLTVTDAQGSTARDTVMITVTPASVLGPDTTIYHNCPGETTNLLPLYNTAGFTAAWNTATPGAVPPGTYQLVVTSAAGCTDTAVVRVVLEVATWTGNVNTSWHTAGNWSTGKVPGIFTHVIIQAVSANGCEVYMANGTAASVQVRNGGEILMSNGMTINITGSCTVLPQ